MSWRPAGWQNPYPKTIVDECSGIEVDSGKYPIFEAGGDAMLQALLAKSTPYRAFQETGIMSFTDGRVVFIPNEEVKPYDFRLLGGG